MAKLIVSFIVAAALVLLNGGTSGAVTLLAPEGLRAGLEAARSVELVNGRRRHWATRCVCPGTRYGPLIIEPGVPAPRAYYADYYERAARYGWWF